MTAPASDGLPGIGRAMLDDGARTAVAARVVDIQGFSTWAGDELVVVGGDGVRRGAILGSTGTSRVLEAARPLLDSGAPELASVVVELHGAAVAEAGLSCGGRAELLLQPTATIPDELWRLLADRAAAALLTRIDGPGRAARSLVVDAAGRTWGALDPGSDAAVAEAVRLLRAGHGATRRVLDEAGTVLVEVWVPAPRLVVVGTGELVGALTAQAGLLGWEVRAVEDRPEARGSGAPAGEEQARGSGAPVGEDRASGGGSGAGQDRAREAEAATEDERAGDERVRGSGAPAGDDRWPALADGLAWAGASAAVVVLSHDPHVDVPALGAALDAGVPYVGAMGSRSTQSRRLERLAASGRTAEELDRIHRPIGLDLGGRSAPEVALAICAEVLASHCGRDARPLREHDGPINDRPTA